MLLGLLGAGGKGKTANLAAKWELACRRRILSLFRLSGLWLAAVWACVKNIGVEEKH